MTCGPNCQVYLYHFILFVWRQRATSSPGPSHIITLTLPTSTLPPSGISDGEHPPWLSQSLMAMSRCQAFVVLTPRLVEGLPYYHDVVSPSSSLTRWIAPAMWCLAGSPSHLLALFLPPPPRSRLHMARCTRYLTKNYVMSHSLWMAFFLCGTLMALSPLPLPPKTPPPWGCVEDIRASLTHLASPWSLSMPRRTKFQRCPMLPPGTPRAALQHFHLAMRTTGSPSRCRCLTWPNCDTVDDQQCYQCKKVFPKYFSGSWKSWSNVCSKATPKNALTRVHCFLYDKFNDIWHFCDNLHHVIILGSTAKLQAWSLHMISNFARWSIVSCDA
jgi:hypothetical protein